MSLASNRQYTLFVISRRSITSHRYSYDQPLYWKGVEIQANEDDGSEMKKYFSAVGGLTYRIEFSWCCW